MPYIEERELEKFGFKSLGHNVRISDRASINNPESISIGDHCRIDDFCVVSGRVEIGRYCHVTPQCLIAGGLPGVFIDDFCTFAYGVKIFSQSDDYTGLSMTNSLIPRRYKQETFAQVAIGRQSIIGAGSVVMPGVSIAEGCAFGAMTLVNKSTDPWGIYIGAPARRLRDRSRALLALENEFEGKYSNDTI